MYNVQYMYWIIVYGPTNTIVYSFVVGGSTISLKTKKKLTYIDVDLMPVEKYKIRVSLIDKN